MGEQCGCVSMEMEGVSTKERVLGGEGAKSREE